MFCGINAKKKNCLISNTEHLVAKIRSVRFSFLLSILEEQFYTYHSSVSGQQYHKRYLGKDDEC